MTLRSPRRRTGEEGQASLFLLLGLAFSLLAIMLLFARLGNANDLRSQAQTAADAAALAAVGDTQDRIVESLVSGSLVHFSSWREESGGAAAEKYARENNAVVTDIRASDNILGLSGNHVRVTVRGAQCQRELEEDGSRHWNDTVCQGDEEEEEIDTFAGEAEAIARIDVPSCSIASGLLDGDRVQCGGQVIRSERDARAVTNVQLVDQEGRYLYEGLGSVNVNSHELAGGDMQACDAPNAGTVTPLMCETHKATLAQFDMYAGSGWSGCYRAAEDGGDHPRGRACDYMVNLRGDMPSREEEALGDATAAWMQENAEELGVRYIIWKQRIWHIERPQAGWVDMENRGDPTQNHFDHVHLSVNG